MVIFKYLTDFGSQAAYYDVWHRQNVYQNDVVCIRRFETRTLTGMIQEVVIRAR